MKKKSKVLMWFVFIIYLILLLKVVLIRLPLGELKDAILHLNLAKIWHGFINGQLIPFKTIYHHYRYTSIHNMITGFGWLTLWAIPLGYFIPVLTKNRKYVKILVFGLLIGLLLESLQLILLSTSFNVDDVIQVGIGISLGFAVFKLFRY
ncbi:MAG: VanZ family protein [Clostridia bacterium]|nr:VanZ family protein [Clostridia bacterium]